MRGHVRRRSSLPESKNLTSRVRSWTVDVSNLFAWRPNDKINEHKVMRDNWWEQGSYGVIPDEEIEIFINQLPTFPLHDHYLPIECIGEGASCQVYRAMHGNVDIAIKRMPRSSANQALFCRECGVLKLFQRHKVIYTFLHTLIIHPTRSHNSLWILSLTSLIL